MVIEKASTTAKSKINLVFMFVDLKSKIIYNIKTLKRYGGLITLEAFAFISHYLIFVRGFDMKTQAVKGAQAICGNGPSMEGCRVTFVLLPIILREGVM